MYWFGICLNTALIAAIGVLQLFFVGRFTRRSPQLWHYLLYLLLLFGSDWLANALEISWLGIALELLATYWMGRLALGSGSLMSWTAAILAVYVPQLAFGILNPLQIIFFQPLLGRPLLWLLLALSSLLALGGSLLCYHLMLSRFSLQEGRGDAPVWLLLTPGLFLFAVELYLLDTAYSQLPAAPYQPDPGHHLALLGLQLLALGALFCTLYAYRRTCDSFQTQAALASLTQETRAQRTYVDQAQLRYTRTRAFRHDLNNHLAVLEGLLKRGETAQAEAYLRKLSAVTGELSFPVSTGNQVVDILLGDKLALAQAEGTRVELSLALPQSGDVEDMDLCVIFGNALDNALHACRQCPAPTLLRISGEQQGDFLRLEFENTCLDAPAWRMDTGLSNVKAVAEKYGGTMTVDLLPQRFRLNVLLNRSGHQKDHSRQNP